MLEHRYNHTRTHTFYGSGTECNYQQRALQVEAIVAVSIVPSQQLLLPLLLRRLCHPSPNQCRALWPLKRNGIKMRVSLVRHYHNNQRHHHPCP
jgi:hypothetical protein